MTMTCASRMRPTKEGRGKEKKKKPLRLRKSEQFPKQTGNVILKTKPRLSIYLYQSGKEKLAASAADTVGHGLNIHKYIPPEQPDEQDEMPDFLSLFVALVSFYLTALIDPNAATVLCVNTNIVVIVLVFIEERHGMFFNL